MVSLNVPVPGAVARLASDLHPRLTGFDRIRERHTLVVKRFEANPRVGDSRGRGGRDGGRSSRSGRDGRGRGSGRDGGRSGDPAADRTDRLRERLRPVLAGTPAFEARVVGVDAFEQPVRGDGPVAYLAVESPGLWRLHRTLVEAFGAVEGLEGDDYVPHVTLARGGSAAAIEALDGLDVEPVSWTVSELALWDDRYRETVARLGLPR